MINLCKDCIRKSDDIDYCDFHYHRITNTDILTNSTILCISGGTNQTTHYSGTSIIMTSDTLRFK